MPAYSKARLSPHSTVTHVPMAFENALTNTPKNDDFSLSFLRVSPSKQVDSLNEPPQCMFNEEYVASSLPEAFENMLLL